MRIPYPKFTQLLSGKAKILNPEFQVFRIHCLNPEIWREEEAAVGYTICFYNLCIVNLQHAELATES